MRQYEKPNMEIIYLSLKSNVRTTDGWGDDDWTIGGEAFSSGTGEPEWA